MDMILGSSKAITAFIVTAIVVWYNKKGLVLSNDSAAEIATGVSALLAGLLVWVVKNKPATTKKK